MANDYLKRILTSKVYDVAVETPLEPANTLSARIDNTVLLKREDTQPVFSFKLRGAYNKMAHLPASALARGVIAASAGNHAQGVALSAQRLGCRAVIVMPTTTPEVKVDAVRRLGGEVVLAGESFSEAYAEALKLEKAQKLTFVHPFDDPDVIAGQGTIGMEILRQHAGPLDAIFVAIGGGGMISGIAAYVKQLRPDVRIIGVQSEGSDAMMRSVRAGRRVTLTDVSLFSDGTAVKQVGAETFKLAKQYVDDYIVVDTDAICAAIKDVFQDTRSVLEPAGAMAIAGAKQYAALHKWKNKTLVAVACGANMNFNRLRFVTERAEVGEMREAVFAVTMPEQKGSFHKLCELIGERSVTEFNYRIADTKKAHVLVSLEIASPNEVTKMVASFKRHGFDAMDLTQNELAKTHLRHMIGGHAPSSDGELLYRFEFPERAGALLRFLGAMDPAWNITLFHYRHQGPDFGRVLIGFQIPPGDKAKFRGFLSQVGYPHWNETDNPAYRLFL